MGVLRLGPDSPVLERPSLDTPVGTGVVRRGRDLSSRPGRGRRIRSRRTCNGQGLGDTQVFGDRRRKYTLRTDGSIVRRGVLTTTLFVPDGRPYSRSDESR